MNPIDNTVRVLANCREPGCIPHEVIAELTDDTEPEDERKNPGQRAQSRRKVGSPASGTTTESDCFNCAKKLSGWLSTTGTIVTWTGHTQTRTQDDRLTIMNVIYDRWDGLATGVVASLPVPATGSDNVQTAID